MTSKSQIVNQHVIKASHNAKD